MLATVLSLVIAAQPEIAATDPCTHVDERQREFTVCFDPWRGFETFAGGRLSGGSVDFTVSATLRLRKERGSRSKTESSWLGLHRIGAADWAPLARRLDATAWEFVFRRHAADTAISLPGFPDARLPFPFDVGLAGAVGRVELGARPDENWSLETARAAVAFDPLRWPTNQLTVSIGPAAFHRVAALTSGAISHELMPFTGGQLFANLESAEGRLFLRANGSGGAVLGLGDARWIPQVRGTLEAGLTVMAINDQPVVLLARAETSWRGGPSPTFEWSASAALGFRFASRR
jgi:hypothetical protein